MYVISKSIQVYEKQFPFAKKIPHCSQFESCEENGIMHESMFYLLFISAGEKCTQESVSQFLQEVMRMKGFMHRNVLTMTGLVMKKNVPYVVLPFMENGDLKSYLGKSEKVCTWLKFYFPIVDH